MIGRSEARADATEKKSPASSPGVVIREGGKKLPVRGK